MSSDVNSASKSTKAPSNPGPGIAPYIKEIGRGKDGARALSREQAADLMGQVLDGHVSDLELGAFCLAMRIKGETAQEMAGFLDATHARLHRPQASGQSVVVLPSYNGARKLPVLTPLLGLLLAREGVPVLIHGTPTESARVDAAKVLMSLGVKSLTAIDTGACTLQAGQVVFAPTGVLLPGLQLLLEVRRVVGLRNSAHSLVKLMNPVDADAVVVGSYTHPEYATSMAEVFALMPYRALLLRGTEGEPVADARRMPQMDGFINGQRELLQEAQSGSLAQLPDLPGLDAQGTAHYIQQVLSGDLPVPAPIARQVECILQVLKS
jgi:anthranilate phosphoribosyltransferase